MKDTATYRVTCPHCGASKLIVRSKESWPKCKYVFWSDGRIESDEWIEPARVLQCSSCGQLFLTPKKEELEEVQTPCENTGKLPLQALKQAVTELSHSEKESECVRMEAWWAYNTMYKDVNEDEIPTEDKEFNRSNMQWLLNYYNQTEPDFQYITFELLRLLGYEKEYRQRLSDMTYEKFAEWYCERRRKRGLDISKDDDMVRRRYNGRVKELTEALGKPLKPYAE